MNTSESGFHESLQYWLNHTMGRSKMIVETRSIHLKDLVPCSAAMCRYTGSGHNQHFIQLGLYRPSMGA